MNTPTPRVDDVRPSRLTRPLYTYSFFEEFILLYPLYALLFADTGLSVAQISSLFVLWSVTSVVVAVPTGALADVVSRRYLLTVAPLLSGTGFALWLLFPTYWVFALGFLLWGGGGALASGAREALVYTELAQRNATSCYPQVMGVARALGVVAAGVATLLAVPVVVIGGYPAIGVASVVACVLATVSGLALPEGVRNSPHTVDLADPDEGYLSTMRRGLVEARRSPQVRPAVLLVVVVGGFWGMLEEYVPLLAVSAGVNTDQVPLVVLVVWACIAVGGLLAGRASRLPPRTLGGLLVVAAMSIGVGALLGTAVGWLLLGVGFGICQLATIVADARLQDRISGSSRATVTSLAEFGVEGVGAVSFLLYAGVFAALGHGWAFAIFALPYAVAATLVGRSKTGT